MTQTNYIIKTTVKSVEEHFTQDHITGMGKDATFSQTSLGFFVLFDGSYECIYFGLERPAFASGDKVKITIEKEKNDAP